MIDVNTTAAALQNAAAVQGLMQNPNAQDYQKMALQAAFQRGNMALQGQIESQRQAALISAEAARQESSQKAAAALQSTGISAEAARQAAAEAAAAALQGTALTAEGKRQSEAQEAQRKTALAVQDKEQQGRVDLQNTAEAERIRADPLTPQLGIDPSKYDPRDAGDNAKLVAAYQNAKTPDAMRKIYADQAQRLTESMTDAKNKIMGYLGTQDGQKAQVMSLLSNPDVTTSLLTSHNTSSTLGSLARLTPADLDAIRITALNGDPKSALDTLNAYMDRASKGAIMGLSDPASGGVLVAARQKAIQDTMNPQTAGPALQQLYQTMQDMGGLRNQSIGQLSQYSPTPQDIARATGTGAGPLTTMLKGATGAPDLDQGLSNPHYIPGINYGNPGVGMQQPDLDQNLPQKLPPGAPLNPIQYAPLPPGSPQVMNPAMMFQQPNMQGINPMQLYQSQMMQQAAYS